MTWKTFQETEKLRPSPFVSRETETVSSSVVMVLGERTGDPDTYATVSPGGGVLLSLRFYTKNHPTQRTSCRRRP